MLSLRSLLVVLGSASFLLSANVANAQSKARATPAEILFQKAVKDMQAGQYEEACQALDASQKLEPKPGTTYALADCEMTRGHSADAYQQYIKYLDLFEKMKSPEREKHAERAAAAKEQKKKIEAELLFEKAKTALAAGRVDEACGALSQSQGIDPKPGTLFALADCEESRGRIATALEHYTKYLGLYASMMGAMRDKHGERARLSEERRRKLEPVVPRLKLVWVGEPPAGLLVTRGGEDLGPVALGIQFAVDPGVHVFVTRVPGKPPVERKVRLEKGTKKVLELRAEDSSLVEEKPKDTTQGGPKKPVDTSNGPAKSPGMHAWKIGGLAAMGVGGATLVAGGVFGYLALQQKDVVNEVCDENFACGKAGMLEVDKFRSLGDTSTALFIVGTAAAGAGLTFFLLAPTAPKEERAALRIRSMVLPGSGFVGLEGAF